MNKRTIAALIAFAALLFIGFKLIGMGMDDVKERNRAVGIAFMEKAEAKARAKLSAKPRNCKPVYLKHQRTEYKERNGYRFPRQTVWQVVCPGAHAKPFTLYVGH